MSQQALDLRRSIQIVRRHKKLVGIVAALGLLGGAAFALLNPVMLMSTALVVLPQTAQNAQSGATSANGTPDSYMATQEVIAGSSPVLSGSLTSIHPVMSLDELRNQIQITSPTSSILAVNATAKTAEQAEALANAVANSYVSYVSSGHSPVGYVPARMLESATIASGSGPVKHELIFGLVGALLGAVIAIIAALAISRKDPRLRERDEIANAIGVPVIASIPVDHPDDAAGWTRLLEEYKPGVVYAWRLQNVLRQLEIHGPGQGNGSYGATSSIAVVSLASDPGALALGPQLAVFAASLGIPVVLAIGPQQDPDVTATLRTACEAFLSGDSQRSSLLRVAVSDDGIMSRYSDATLVVVVAVVDSSSPRLPETMRTATALLAVSAGAVTAEQLARAAVSVATDGRRITGILVADPDPADRTTGRVPQLSLPPRRHRRPTRLSAFTTEISR